MENYSREQRRIGRTLLGKLMPQAQQLADEQGPMQYEVATGLAEVAAPHHHRDNLDALIIYEARNGGWIADVLFKNVPEGLGDVEGTPVDTPFATRNEAVAMGVKMVSMFLTIEPPPDCLVPNPVFEFFDLNISIPRATIEEFREQHREFVEQLDPQEVIDLLERISLSVEDGKIAAKFESMGKNDTDRNGILAAAFLAVQFGILRWPERKAGQPLKPPTTH